MIEQEEVRYDRQIRLWGAETQQRLKHTHLCLWGVRGEAAEMIKNVVLAGVQHVTVIDDALISDEDLKNNMLVQNRHTDQVSAVSRGQCAVDALRRLNPFVDVVVASDHRGHLNGASVTTCDTRICAVQVGCIDEAHFAVVQHGSCCDILLLSCPIDSTSVLTLFLFTRHSCSLEQQLFRFLSDPVTMQLRPAVYQKAALCLHLRNSSSAASFSLLFASAVQLLSRLELRELTVSDAGHVVEGCLSRKVDVDSVTSTMAGAMTAQLVIQLVGGAVARVPGWLLCDSSAVEGLVGEL